jgi:nicotinate-nucleotide adenylyltransferase
MIGVLGGTFDPIHFGHLRPALDLLQGLPLHEVRFIPLNVAVHRPQPVAGATQRAAMLRAAVAGQPGFVVDQRELGRPGGSFTYDTLTSIRGELGAGTPICLLLGSDAFADFLSWHRPEGILSLAHLVVMQRPWEPAHGTASLHSWSRLRSCADATELAASPHGRILFREVTQLEISGTGIRESISRGWSPRYLLPDAVIEIIEREGLYR